MRQAPYDSRASCHEHESEGRGRGRRGEESEGRGRTGGEGRMCCACDTHASLHDTFDAVSNAAAFLFPLGVQGSLQIWKPLGSGQVRIRHQRQPAEPKGCDLMSWE